MCNWDLRRKTDTILNKWLQLDLKDLCWLSISSLVVTFLTSRSSPWKLSLLTSRCYNGSCVWHGKYICRFTFENLTLQVSHICTEFLGLMVGFIDESFVLIDLGINLECVPSERPIKALVGRSSTSCRLTWHAQVSSKAQRLAALECRACIYQSIISPDLW